MLSQLAAGLVLAVALLGHVLLSPPRASADCVLTAQDQHYITLLAQQRIGAVSEHTDCDVAAQGRQIADAVRTADNPSLAASSIAADIYDETNLTADQAAFEVAAAIYVYAPEMVWAIRDSPL